jgi:hypothetical protein
MHVTSQMRSRKFYTLTASGQYEPILESSLVAILNLELSG